MYTPLPFRSDDTALAWELLEEIRLATLISNGERLETSQLPFLIDRERGQHGTLVTHMARPNPQWRALDPAREVVVSALGPNAYVSPSWYAAPRAPTWNYVALQIRGLPRVIDDAAWCRQAVLRLGRTMEPPGTGFSVDELKDDYLDALSKGIVGIEIEVSSVEVQLRLSQQYDEDHRERVRRAFEAGSLRERQVAEAIARFAQRAGKTAP
ncbi:FMN-binding negative transcriptional regulator [Rhodovarius crocodyli]|uniref:FMN-binding negative transcriptional regulator n=1 Tax=Rhodovarius crocodyli TaxID=1979269 RepID=UPI0013E3B20B|nr:FMN-binding negative transcriptional regulator [Rhodovarius crocodyli]